MKITIIKSILTILIGICCLQSCTKIIDLDLEEHQQKIVIEAHVGTETGDNQVIITRSKSFNDPQPIMPISGALVTITNLTDGQVYQLTDYSGVYNNDILAAIEQNTYKLTVELEGKVYTAQSTVPKNVALSSFTQNGSVDDNTFGFSDLANLVPKYTDPGDRKNFYQFIIYRNDSLQQDILLRDDVVYNGLEVSSEIFVEARKNDTITIDFQSIDEPVYRFLFGFAKNVTQTSGTPANPVSNISNGALGYFKAHTSNFEQLIVK